MTDFISVIIATYNPDLGQLNQTLNGLKKQDLSYSSWELIIINNNSTSNFAGRIDLSWHPAAKVIFEQKQGLTYARIKGFNDAKGHIIVMLDDDNVPNEDYLSQTAELFKVNSNLGAAGGKSLPIFEAEPPQWLNNFYANLALRDLGENIVISKWEYKYPDFAPIGAGMAIRKAALKTYIRKIETQANTISDRKGNSLSSGGDNDMVLKILKDGWGVGYFPGLTIQHIIPKQRMDADYLARLINNTNKSWIQVLKSHDICPWEKISKFSVPFRKAKAWFAYSAWKNKVNYIKWQGACGTFDGLAGI